MTRLLLIAAILVVTGCASHYYQVQGDTLVLYLDKPDAQQVILRCSLDDFEPHEARKVDGRWVVFLPSGERFPILLCVGRRMFLPPCR
jgi:hypothetical protein